MLLALLLLAQVLLLCVIAVLRRLFLPFLAMGGVLLSLDLLQHLLLPFSLFRAQPVAVLLHGVSSSMPSRGIE